MDPLLAGATLPAVDAAGAAFWWVASSIRDSRDPSFMAASASRVSLKDDLLDNLGGPVEGD